VVEIKNTLDVLRLSCRGLYNLVGFGR